MILRLRANAQQQKPLIRYLRAEKEYAAHRFNLGETVGKLALFSHIISE